MTLKPGTRCECRDAECPGGCQSFAVRLVTVRDLSRLSHEQRAEFAVDEANGRDLSRWDGSTLAVDVKLCEPCAQFHEAKAGAR